MSSTEESDGAWIRDIAESLAKHGFKDVPGAGPCVLKRQNWNTNRAIVMDSLDELPADFGLYVRQLREDVARRCRFIPVLWPIGIQFVIRVPGAMSIDPSPYVALIDNQWALIQSIFLIDPDRDQFSQARTWGQFVTGKFQDAIAVALDRHYRRAPTP